MDPEDYPGDRVEHDHPAVSGRRSPYPYPNRLSRLNRALQSTNDLVNELGDRVNHLQERIGPVPSEPRRRRFSLIEDADLPPHLQHSSEFLSSVRATRNSQARPAAIHADFTATDHRVTGNVVRSLRRWREDYIDGRRASPTDGTSEHQGLRRPPMRHRRMYSQLADGPERYSSRNWDSRRLADLPPTRDDTEPAAKRRRIFSNQEYLARDPIKYGRRGQVEPGRLKMELISCDGGELVDHRSPQVYLGFNNVLKADHSVYCSSRESVSILLRHADTTAFCVDTLHITAPENGFDAPVMQGVVYVAMELDDLNKYQDRPIHARYSDKNPVRQFTDRSQDLMRRLDRRLSLSEALWDPDIAAYFYRQSTGNASQITDSPDTSMQARTSLRDRWDARKENETPLMPYNAATRHSFDDSAVEEDNTPSDIAEYRYLRRNTQARTRLGTLTDRYHALMASQSPDANVSTSRRDVEPRTIPLESNGSSSSGEDTVKQKSPAALPFEDPNVTFVPFYIEEGKSRIAIKFEPQVSGRFVLLKLSAEMGKGNVDVQSIVVSGFAGPRFFPAKDFS